MIRYVLLPVLTWVAWKLLRILLPARSQIDKLPGPPRTSWLRGMFSLGATSYLPEGSPLPFFQGHLPQIYDVQGWAFHRELTKYGPVFKLQNTLGVRMISIDDHLATICISHAYSVLCSVFMTR